MQLSAANEILEGLYGSVYSRCHTRCAASLNMNVNEVIANRAIEILEGKRRL